MTGRHAVVALIAGLFATSAMADNAVRRDGSSGGSNDAGARHTPSAHSSGSPSASSHSGGTSYSGGGSDRSSSALSPAQRRQPRPGTGTGGYGGGYYRGHRPGYPGYRPGYGYYPGYGYGSYWWPYGSFYGGFYGGGYLGGGYYGGGYYPYGGGIYTYAHSDRASLRILVDQPDARVYVDGYYAGVVDDFDGLFQRLYVSPGRHDVAFKLQGYQTHHVKVYVGSGSTLKLHHDMQRGTGPETVEDLAGDREERYAPREGDRYGRRDDDRRFEARDRDAEEDDVDADRPPARADRVPSGERGRLRLNVLPEDASVYVDGQFKGSARQASSIELPPGRHRMEVVRPGFRTDEREFEVEAGVTRDLNVELQRP